MKNYLFAAKARKYLPLLMLASVFFFAFAGPAGATVLDDSLTEDNIYTPDEDNILVDKATVVVKLVGGLGGVGFVLGILFISFAIILGSISPKNKGIWWGALISCVAGAFIFFSAFGLAPAIADFAFQ